MAFVYVDAHPLSLPRAQQAARNYAAAVSLREIRDPKDVEAYIKSDPTFKRELTFSLDHVHKKYSVFNNLNDADIDTLFADRWKYFRYRDNLVSVSFVDPALKADNFVNSSIELGDRINVAGRVSDAIGSYHVPRLIPIESGKHEYTALSWLFLYNGAFRRGDSIEAVGRECQIGNEPFILVETPDDYIRKVRTQAP